MQRLDGTPIFSASDLVGYLACDHLTSLEFGAADGLCKRPAYQDPELDLLQRKGGEHETSVLARLGANGKSISRFAFAWPRTLTDLQHQAAETRTAMQKGVDVIYQGVLLDGRWQGRPDFLLRTERPSALGPWSYEPADAKLAGSVKAGALLQLCLYADLLKAAQGQPPQRIGVITGDSEEHWYRLDDFAAYFRSVRARFEERAASAEHATYPDPVDHCRICRWSTVCADKRREDDHLCRVANITRSHTQRLVTGGVGTLTALAILEPETHVPDVPSSTLERLRAQAALQQLQYADGKVRYELIPLDPAEPLRGLARLPEPNPADLFLDFENDPWAGEDGLEYLVGVIAKDDGAWRYRALWAHSAAEERRAFEQLIDEITQRRAANPGMHVYHYGAYEDSTLKRLASRYGTREDELDSLIKQDVLVDLYTVVRQGVRISQETYSLKKVEALYGFKREGPVTRPGFATVEYERWLVERDAAILQGIEAYNKDDCVALVGLRDWLEERRLEAMALFGAEIQRPVAPEPQPEEDPGANAQRIAALTHDIPAERAARTNEQQARFVLAHLLDWHRRDARPGWWKYFSLLEATQEDLIASSEALGGLTYVGPQAIVKRSQIHRYRYPEQEHKFDIGDKAIDPATQKAAAVVAIDHAERTIDVIRGLARAGDHPAALIPAGPINTDAMREALRRVADSVIEAGIDTPGPYRAARDLLLRHTPRVAGLSPGQPLRTPGEDPLKAAERLVLALDEGCLPIQGPPGSGKTYTGARMILALVKAGKKVGIAAGAHKAITNLVDEVCSAARGAKRSVRIIQRADGQGSVQPEVTISHDSKKVAPVLRDGQFDVVAGTAWLFSRSDMEGLLDVLFVDEAGQMSLANVVAMSGAARSLVLLGDPNQLPQVTQGTHPDGVGVSALEHVLGDSQTITPDRGLFLDKTWRMHPAVCSYVSTAFYEGLLEPHETTRQQGIGAAPVEVGTRVQALAHHGNSSRSPEEASAVADLVGSLLGRPWTNQKGVTRDLTVDNILIVAPYNLQVGEIQRTLLARIGNPCRVGTVDKFQGQEGAVAIYSTATSSPDDAPRDVEFLYSRNRLNVAISRARALAYLVTSPELLRVRCRTPEEMRMANAFCLLLESANPTYFVYPPTVASDPEG